MYATKNENPTEANIPIGAIPKIGVMNHPHNFEITNPVHAEVAINTNGIMNSVISDAINFFSFSVLILFFCFYVVYFVTIIHSRTKSIA